MVDWMNRTDEHFGELHADIAELRQEMNVKFAEFMKWTLGFWVASLITYVGAIVALANVLK